MSEYLDALNKLVERAHKVLGKDAIKEVAAPLTTKERKEMRSTTFCGPNRSFPVPDCKHVAVAKAYLNRSKFSKSTKKRIAACINRKAKSLGCPSGKKAKAYIEYSYEVLTKEQQDIYDNASLYDSTRALVDDSLANPDLDLFCSCSK